MIGVNIEADAMKRSASDYVTEVLRKSIITRELAQGERLVEIDIAKKLNVSITPVRHAFMQLSKEGLIEVYPYKGSYVTKITSKLVSDMSVCRTMLEPECALYAYDNFLETDPDYLKNIGKRSTSECSCFSLMLRRARNSRYPSLSIIMRKSRRPWR